MFKMYVVKHIVNKILEGASVLSVLLEDFDSDQIKSSLDAWKAKYVKLVGDAGECYSIAFKYTFETIYTEVEDNFGTIYFEFEPPYGVYPSDNFYVAVKDSLEKFGLSWDIKDKKFITDYVDDGMSDVSKDVIAVRLFNISLNP